MELKGKKVIILVEQIFNDHEFWYPYFRLKEAGAEVKVVGSGSAITFNGKFGTSVQPDVNADQVNFAEYDGIIIPGGYAPDHMRRFPAMVKLVKDLFDNNKVVASICHAGWMLASANIVRGKTVTSYIAIKDDLTNAGANWIDQEVVVDKNIITSRTPDDLPAFMRTIINALKES